MARILSNSIKHSKVRLGKIWLNVFIKGTLFTYKSCAVRVGLFFLISLSYSWLILSFRRASIYDSSYQDVINDTIFWVLTFFYHGVWLDNFYKGPTRLSFRMKSWHSFQFWGNVVYSKDRCIRAPLLPEGGENYDYN